MRVSKSWRTLVASKRFDGLVYFALFAILLIQLIKLGDKPGLYFDAMYPDYIGVQYLFPQQYYVRSQAAEPWLCQIYHGNIGVWITLLSVLITGTTSILQHHIVYGIFAAACVGMLYSILTHRRVGVPKELAAAAVLVFTVWPCLWTVVITQYYMSLAGSLCVLGCARLYLSYLETPDHHTKLIAGWFLLGVSFYTYFCFLFFVPAFLVATWRVLPRHDWKATLDRLILCLISYLFGCAFYLIGYTQIALYKAGYSLQNLQKFLLFVVFYSLLLLMYELFRRRVSLRYGVLGAGLVVCAVWAVKVLPYLASNAESLQVMGAEPTSLVQKVAHIFNDFSYLISVLSTQRLILGYDIIAWDNQKIWLFWLVLTVVTFLMERISKRKSLPWKALFMVWGSYLLCCVAFGSRMQPQHYVPLTFVMVGLVACQMSSLYTSVTVLGKKAAARNARIVGVVFTAVLLLVSAVDSTRILQEIRVTGGNGRFTSQLTQLAYDALENAEQGEKELYLFPDWGFFTGFDYLTRNSIPFQGNLDEEVSGSYFADGGNLVLCCWEKEDVAQYEAFLHKVMGSQTGSIVTEEKYNPNGSLAFYKLTLSHDAEL